MSAEINAVADLGLHSRPILPRTWFTRPGVKDLAFKFKAKANVKDLPFKARD